MRYFFCSLSAAVSSPRRRGASSSKGPSSGGRLSSALIMRGRRPRRSSAIDRSGKRLPIRVGHCALSLRMVGRLGRVNLKHKEKAEGGESREQENVPG